LHASVDVIDARNAPSEIVLRPSMPAFFRSRAEQDSCFPRRTPAAISDVTEIPSPLEQRDPAAAARQLPLG
jgi:hypothetical protein